MHFACWFDMELPYCNFQKSEKRTFPVFPLIYRFSLFGTLNPEENIGDVPHIYELVDNASYMTVKQAQLQSKARSYKKPASDFNKDTAAVAATDSCKSMPGTVATMVIACFNILVALGAMAIAVSTLANMATMQSGLMDADTMETNTSCLCM